MSADDTPAEPCVFCEIVAERARADIVAKHAAYVVFTPLNPHVPGHVLVVPRWHVESAAKAPGLTGTTMSFAASWAASQYDDFNLLTSSGAKATQTVKHLHVHVIPRGDAEDDLHPDWPWMRERS